MSLILIFCDLIFAIVAVNLLTATVCTKECTYEVQSAVVAGWSSEGTLVYVTMPGKTDHFVIISDFDILIPC